RTPGKGPGPVDKDTVDFFQTTDWTDVAAFHDPTDPSFVILFAAQGTADGGPINDDDSFSNQVYLSIDSGVNWFVFDFPTTDSAPVLIDPVNNIFANELFSHQGSIKFSVGDSSDLNGGLPSFTAYAPTAYPTNYPPDHTTNPPTPRADTLREIRTLTLFSDGFNWFVTSWTNARTPASDYMAIARPNNQRF